MSKVTQNGDKNSDVLLSARCHRAKALWVVTVETLSFPLSAEETEAWPSLRSDIGHREQPRGTGLRGPLPVGAEEGCILVPSLTS